VSKQEIERGVEDQQDCIAKNLLWTLNVDLDESNGEMRVFVKKSKDPVFHGSA